MPSFFNKKRLFSLYIGNILEFYDYSLYGFLIPHIAPLFFPGKDYIASLISGYGVFALGICARIVGAAVFGHIGDKYGRRKVIFWSITIMGYSTAFIGCLPTYEHLGQISTILLIFLRICQGFSLGGAYTGSVVYLNENLAKENRSLALGKTHFAGSSGWFLGSFISLIFTSSQDDLLWRIPFLLGGLGCLAGFFCQKFLYEDQKHISLKFEGYTEKFPLLILLKSYLIKVFYVAGIATLISCTFHIFFILPNSLLPKFLRISFSLASSITTFGIGVYTIMLLPMGWLASKIESSKLMIFSSSSLVILSYPLFTWLVSGICEKMFFAEAIISILLSCFVISACLEMPRLFPAKVRLTGVSFGYNLGLCFLGGTAPMIAIMLVDSTGYILAPCFYLISCCFLGLTSSIMIYKNFFTNQEVKNINI